MEESLTPLARALRRFNAGKPLKQLKDTPLAIVVLAVEQRDRLANFLAGEEGVESPKITATNIVGLLKVQGSTTPLVEHVEIEDGKESEAVAWLEAHRNYGHKFRTSGFVFVIRVGRKEHIVSYRVERTPEGDAVLKIIEMRLERVLR